MPFKGSQGFSQKVFKPVRDIRQITLVYIPGDRKVRNEMGI